MPTEAGNPITEYLGRVDTPTISNAIERLGLRPKNTGFAPVSIRCIFPELGPMCGFAVTAQAETVTDACPASEGPFIELFEAVERSPKPAVVVLQETGSHSDFAVHSGEIMATIFKRLGAIGLVSDCAVRDLREVRRLGFHLFARGAVASHANFRIVRAGIPVQILGMSVRPGDLLHGDENGLIQIPNEALGRIKEAVSKVRSAERSLLEFVSAPEFTAGKLRGRFLE